MVRLPRIHWAKGQVDLEATWLPRLSPFLPVVIPRAATIQDRNRFAMDLSAVVRALCTVPVDDAPKARNRARPLQEYDVETQRAIDSVENLIDADAARAVWGAALSAPPHEGGPVWVQGDLEGNCLVRDGHLSGIVDWGSACAGDPAVDVQVVWSPLFTDESRTVFVQVLNIDDATLARSRGAAIHQACAALGYYMDTYPLIVERSWYKLAAVGVAARSTE